MWREHATETARVLNEINPAFIRLRTLAINHGMPLHDEIENSNFIRATDEQIVEEERLFIERLDCRTKLVSDHITNLLQEIEGTLPRDKGKMLACIDRFQALSPEEKANFKLGRRMGIYIKLDDLGDSSKQQLVEQLTNHLKRDNNQEDDKAIHTLMEKFI